jgi:hypothetical protein
MQTKSYGPQLASRQLSGMEDMARCHDTSARIGRERDQIAPGRFLMTTLAVPRRGIMLIGQSEACTTTAVTCSGAGSLLDGILLNR